jgi:hypothetical protein
VSHAHGGTARASVAFAMNANAATSFESDVDTFRQDIDDAFRSRILTALRDVRAREKRASSTDLRADLHMGDAANDG